MKLKHEKTITIYNLQEAIHSLANFIYSGVNQKLDSIRIARACYAIINAGCASRNVFMGKIIPTFLLNTQQKDGGWADIEETVWCLACLKTFERKFKKEIKNGQTWLSSNRLKSRGWGKSERDQARIPTTALMAALTPEIVNQSSLRWLANQWTLDLGSPTKLTYKGAFFLISQIHKDATKDVELINRTINYLINEQEIDGGFAPWKGHPVGSDPWSTGVVLWGLSEFIEDKKVDKCVQHTIKWLGERQLPNGLWPYHYMDDAASMILIGLSSVLNSMEQ